MRMHAIMPSQIIKLKTPWLVVFLVLAVVIAAPFSTALGLETDPALTNSEEIFNSPQPPDGIETRVVALQYANATQVQMVLENLKSPQGNILMNVPDSAQTPLTFTLTDTVPYLDEMQKFIQQIDVPVEIRTFELKHVPARGVAKDLQKNMSPNVGRLDFSEEIYQLIVTETPQRMPEIAAMIEQLDQPTREILIQTKTLQILLNDEHLDGVDWEAIVSDYQTVSFGQRQLVLGTISEEDYMVLLDALDTVGITTTIANRRMTTALEEPAFVAVKPLKVFKPSEHENLKTALSPDDLSLKLTPHIEDKVIHLKIQPEFANPQSKTEDKFSTATIEMEEGSTIVVGGLFAPTRFESQQKIPLLGDLPLVGFVFRNDREQTRKSEVITFLTPRVILKEEAQKLDVKIKDVKVNVVE